MNKSTLSDEHLEKNNTLCLLFARPNYKVHSEARGGAIADHAVIRAAESGGWIGWLNRVTESGGWFCILALCLAACVSLYSAQSLIIANSNSSSSLSEAAFYIFHFNNDQFFLLTKRMLFHFSFLNHFARDRSALSAREKPERIHARLTMWTSHL